MYLITIKQTTSRKVPKSSNDYLTFGGFLSTPYEIDGETVRASYVGDEGQIKRFIDFLDGTGAPYKIVSLREATVPWRTPLDRLTEKQKKILVTAFHLDYYDIPKKTSIEKLARSLHLSLNPEC